MVYHVHITSKNPAAGKRRSENELDLSAEELEERFLKPYRAGSPIVIRGHTITISDLDRIMVFQTDRQLGKPQEIPWRTMSEVTREFITGPPGTVDSYPSLHEEQRPATDAREVFVVHGRNYGAREALYQFLRSIDLYPLGWSEAVQSTGKPSPYVGEILKAVFSRAPAVVVLFTPDDEARLRVPFQLPVDPPHETQLSGQARPNVLFEAGMAMGRSADRTILVEMGLLRPFSDVAGRHVLRLDNSTQCRQELAQRLSLAGCPVKMDGTAWHSAGDFDPALVMPSSGSSI